MTKLLSVIVPVYNVKNELPKCIDSILNQTYSLLELILVDDGSYDGSGEICDSYKEIDDRVRVIHQKNQGVGAARNIGIRVANGDYIGFVDADDWIAADMYERLIAHMEIAGADIGICGMKNVVGDTLLGKTLMPHRPSRLLTADEAMECLLRETFSGSLCNKVYNASLLRGRELAENIFSLEDYLYNIVLFPYAKGILQLYEDKYFYRQRQGSSTHSLKLKNTISYLQVFPRIRRVIYAKYPTLIPVYWEIYKKFLIHGLVDFLQMNSATGRSHFQRYRRFLFGVIIRKHFTVKDGIYLLFFSNSYKVCQFWLRCIGLDAHGSSNWIKKMVKGFYAK